LAVAQKKSAKIKKKKKTVAGKGALGDSSAKRL